MNGKLPRLYVVADADFVGDTERWLARLAALDAVAAHSALAIQVRAKRRSGAEFEALARQARRAVVHAPLVLNGPPALAAALGYDGVHWPAGATAGEAFSRMDGLGIRTAAIHSAAAVHDAERAGATALVFAPVFAPSWKSAVPAGVDALRQAVAVATRPVYALGGITPAQVAACLAAGAYGIAVLSGVMAARDPGAVAAAYLAALPSRHREGRSNR